MRTATSDLFIISAVDGKETSYDRRCRNWKIRRHGRDEHALNSWGRFRPSRTERFRAAIIGPARIS